MSLLWDVRIKPHPCHWGVVPGIGELLKSTPHLFFHCHHAKPEPSLRTHESTNITPVVLESCSALVKVCKKERIKSNFLLCGNKKQ